MISGMSPFTLIHVIISIVAIVSGAIVVAGLLASRRPDGWTAMFLATALATNVTGFLFPFRGFTPAMGLGILSTIVLAAAIAAYYAFHLAGAWRRIYAAGAVIALYFNVFVLIVQSFQKVPALKMLAPTQTEPPFAIVQALALLVFVGLGIGAVRRFRPSA
jgi:hypothetical protein